jgi:hypothetical protein
MSGGSVPDIPEAATADCTDELTAWMLKWCWLPADLTRAQVREVCAEAVARVLEVAAPHLEEHVAQKILAHMEAHGPKLLPGANADIYNRPRRTWRRHFGIAARIAAKAFSTEDELMAAAAAALAAGQYVACNPEVPGEHG